VYVNALVSKLYIIVPPLSLANILSWSPSLTLRACVCITVNSYRVFDFNILCYMAVPLFGAPRELRTTALGHTRPVDWPHIQYIVYDRTVQWRYWSHHSGLFSAIFKFVKSSILRANKIFVINGDDAIMRSWARGEVTVPGSGWRTGFITNFAYIVCWGHCG
jgi:hypothetical protein